MKLIDTDFVIYVILCNKFRSFNDLYLGNFQWLHKTSNYRGFWELLTVSWNKNVTYVEAANKWY